ncbi:PotD/PotF family extracellular solute-binding protein [Hyphomicrobium sp.]|jgi:spermidine/putrescine transport system substrate-binding protein|uniref:ABC transporter substrate-binding protein n=1 Tax=Hyphomicrobium sp. TaxID=82 RepID=UPI003562D2DC
MSSGDGKSKIANLSRRQILGTGVAVAGAAMLPLPAIIGKARAADAKTAFKGEEMTVCAWSGGYLDSFKTAISDPFNEQYGTKVSLVGGWDQMVAQMKAAPAGKPPFDITVSEEYTTLGALAEGLYAKSDRSKFPQLADLQPFFLTARPESARDYGVPLGLGFALPMLNTSLAAGKPLSWTTMWDKDLEGKLALDAGAYWWLIAISAIWGAKKDFNAFYDWKPGMASDPIFEALERLRPAKYYKDGAELSFLMLQEQAAFAEIYSADALGLMQNGGPNYQTGIPADGTVAYGDWYIKVKGTQHDELADMFLGYLLEKETQNRFIKVQMSVMSRKDVTVPAFWHNYPSTNEDLVKNVQLMTMAGLERLLPSFDAMGERFQKAVLKTSKG